MGASKRILSKTMVTRVLLTLSHSSTPTHTNSNPTTSLSIDPARAGSENRFPRISTVLTIPERARIGTMAEIDLNSPYLLAFSHQVETLKSTLVHADYFPIGYLTLFHAIRVSHATRQVSGGLESRLSILQGVLLNQILLFGSVMLSSVMLGTTSPLFLAPRTIATYISVHLFLKLSNLGDFLLALNQAPVFGPALDFTLCLLDGVCRSEGVIILGVEEIRRQNSPSLSGSLYACILNGSILGGGAPLLIQAFNLDSPVGDWKLQAPLWAKSFKSLLAMTDLWSATLVSTIYCLVTDASSSTTSSSSFLSNPTTDYKASFANQFAGGLSFRGMPKVEAQMLSALILTTIFTIQKSIFHLYRAPSTSSQSSRSPAPTRVKKIGEGLSADSEKALLSNGKNGHASPSSRSRNKSSAASSRK
ncbi:hypothetical protein IE53DRAFT_80056 [Violaceomyces palustris]|uniref:Uncharacterized protein n=1 Tax=Violaceomyces palustris TaxID=1673888 RepID=A0ACD0P790_9BASI|nr:hypothetical protein IE53DRAFT_80056 [Violaceomyces palustris]